MRKLAAVLVALALLSLGARADNNPTVPAQPNNSVQYNKNGWWGGTTTASDAQVNVSGALVLQNTATARSDLGLGSIATQNANAVAITGGNVNGTAIGSTTSSTGTFSSITVGGCTGCSTGLDVTSTAVNATQYLLGWSSTGVTNAVNTNLSTAPTVNLSTGLVDINGALVGSGYMSAADGLVVAGTNSVSLNNNGVIEYTTPNMRFSLPSTESYYFYNQGRGTNLLMELNGSTGAVNIPSLTASGIVETDGSKNLTSLSYTTTPGYVLTATSTAPAWQASSDGSNIPGTALGVIQQTSSGNFTGLNVPPYIYPTTTPPASAFNIIGNGLFVDVRDPAFGSNTCTGYYEIASTSLGSGGSGYAVNDKFYITSTIQSGQIIANLAQGHVTSVNGSGAVTGYSIDVAGGGYSTNSGVTTTAITGSGSGLTINITGIGTGNDDTSAFEKAMATMGPLGGTVLIPNGCWVDNLLMVNGVTLQGNGYNVDYGYDYQPQTRMFIIGAPSYGINLNGIGSAAFVGFEVTGIYDGSDFGSTSCVGSTVGAPGYPQGKVWFLNFSAKACSNGFNPSGGYVYTVSKNSDWGANNYGINGTVSDFVSDTDTFVSQSVGINLASGNGQFTRIINDRFEYLGIGIQGQSAFEVSIDNNQFDHNSQCAISLTSYGELNLSNNAFRGNGLNGSLTVTGVANNGSGLYRLTVSGQNSPPTSSISTGNQATVAGTVGAANLNGNWTITKVDGTHIDLQSSTYASGYTSGGYVGVWGADADICLSSTGANKGLHMSNNLFLNAAAVSGPSAPAYVLDMTTTAADNNYIDIRGGYLMPKSAAGADSGTSYSIAIANWETFGSPANVTFDTVGSPPYQVGNNTINVNNIAGGSSVDFSAATSAITLPVGTTGQRPTMPVNGMLRYNSSTPAVEAYENNVWGTVGGGGLNVTSTAANSTFYPLFASTTGAPLLGANLNSGFSINPSTGLFSANALTLSSTLTTDVTGSIQCLEASASGVVVGTGSVCGGSGSAPGGSTGQLQFNNTTFGGASGLWYNSTTTGLNIGTGGTGVNGISLPDNGLDTTGVSIGASAGLAETVTNLYNVAIGYDALQHVTTSPDNTAVGYAALAALTTSTGQNVDIGYNAGNATTVGYQNTAVGYAAGASVTTGYQNVAVGNTADHTTSTHDAISIGYGATATGNFSTVIGEGAADEGATYSIALGANAKDGYGGSFGNVVLGEGAGAPLGDTSYNTLVGYSAGSAMVGGQYNTGVGGNVFSSGNYNSPGSYNTAVGYSAMAGVTTTSAADNVAIGYQTAKSITTGANNVVIGYEVGQTTLTTGSNNILIGTTSALDAVTSSTNNEINIGNTLFYNSVGAASAPVVSSCGTSPSIDSHANNKSGTVTIGTVAATSCTITFAGGGYTTWDHCRVTAETASLAAVAYSYTKAAITITGTSLVGAIFDYDCDGY